MRTFVLFILACAAPAHANLFDVFGANARSTAMAGAGTALANDASAAFHNPAGLAFGPRVFSFGVLGNFNRASILLKPRPSGYDPPRYGVGTRPRSDSENPPGTAGFSLGFKLKLFDDDLSVGGIILLPADGFGFTNTHYADERAQYFSNRLHFELVDTRLRKEVMAFAFAYRLRDWLSMGAGVMVLPGSSTINKVYTPNGTDPGSVELTLDVQQSLRWALTAGLVATPVDWLRLGVVFQDEIYFGLKGYNWVMISGEEETPVRQDLNAISGYSPPRISGSVALLSTGELTSTVEATWRGWSRYLDNQGTRTEFNDTLDWKLGLEYALSERSVIRAGAGWSPSPIPRQDGRTNYVDNDRAVFSFGAGRNFVVFGEPITVDLGLQIHALLTEDVDKAVRADGQYPDCTPSETALCDELPTDDSGLFFDPRATEGLQTGNPGFPGYTHGGYIMAASLDLKWLF
jgi:hypothetical protein